MGSNVVGDLFAGRYLIEARLGPGAYGEVWRAKDQHLDQVVALKILSRTQPDDAWQEARRLTALESPNILRVSNADLAIDVPYIASVLATRGTAADEMKPLGMAPARAVTVIRGMLRGLQLCHDRQILHRDVKPANIFIGATGDALLGDFGCAALMSPDGSGNPHGDPDIRAPEVLKGGSCTRSSDVYSAGVSLYAMLTGSLPFSLVALGDFKALRDAAIAGCQMFETLLLTSAWGSRRWYGRPLGPSRRNGTERLQNSTRRSANTRLPSLTSAVLNLRQLRTWTMWDTTDAGRPFVGTMVR